MPTRRFGLSFETAAPAASHPHRTDIACFVGAVARRRAAVPVTVLPEVLARWLEQAEPALTQVPLRSRRVDLQSAASLLSSLQDALVASQRVAQSITSVATVIGDADGPALDALLAACRTLTPLPAALIDGLVARGFSPGTHLDADPLAAWLRVQTLHDLPLPLDDFETFDALFAWDERPVLALAPRPGDPQVCTALGAAVRAFFGEGGLRCYVVRSGDPVPLLASASDRFGVLSALDHGARRRTRTLEGEWLPAQPEPLPGRRPQLRGLVPDFGAPIETLQGLGFDGAPAIDTSAAGWSGLEHVFGLPDVSFAALPDLPDAVAYRLDEAVPPPPPAGTPATVFSDCEETPRDAPRPSARLIAPPRARDDGLRAWIALVRRALAVLDNNGRAFHRRDVQLLTSLPLAAPARGAPQPDDWLAWMARQGVASGWWSDDLDDPRGEAFARLQVAAPWLVTRDSADCAGGLEAPEGTLAGVLARRALAAGAYRLAAFEPVRRFVAAEPALDLSRARDAAVDTPAGPLTLAERVCLIGPSPRGPQLLSDVSFATLALWRPGSVRRLVNVVVNAARRLGDDHAFEPNAEALWDRLRQRLGDLGRELLAAGALSSDAGRRAFVVRCGRDTMTQADLDAGRLVAEIELVPAQPIVRIAVVLALRDAQPLIAVRQAA